MTYLSLGMLPNLTIKNFVVNMTMFQGFFYIVNIDSVYWTLAYEIIFYAFIAMMLMFGLYRYKMTFLWGGILFSLFALSCDAFRTRLPSLLEYFPGHFPLFAAGALFCLAKQKGYNKKIVLALFVSFFCYIFAIMKFKADNYQLTHEIYYRILITAFFYLIFVLVSTNKTRIINNPHFEKLGNVTYPLYLIHMPIATMIYALLGSVLSDWALLIVTVFICISASHIIHLYVEKPSIAFMRLQFKRIQ